MRSLWDILGAGLARLDPGWLFLLAGLTILSVTALIPAQDDLAEARLQLARARAIEARASARLEKYSDYLDALSQTDEALLVSLAATQLNVTPEGKRAHHLPGEPSAFDANVFRNLEPAPTPLPELVVRDSLLRRLATGQRSRLFLYVGGAICVLIGLLPPARAHRAAPV